MNLKVKVCGMRDAKNILDVASLNPDYMGFIFYDKSPRYVGSELIIPHVEKDIKRVGVFVNSSYDFIVRVAKKYSLSTVQLHGGESVELCKQLRSNGLEIIKVFSVDSNFEFKFTGPFESTADYFLFDTKDKNYGGTGKTFDWSLLEKYTSEKPFFLSGGLDLNNVFQVQRVRSKNLFGVDLNSGVEASPGLKDIIKLKRAFSDLNQLRNL